MAIVSAWHCKPNDGDRKLVVMLGRRSSTELNAIRYKGSTSWTASDTAWSSTTDASGNTSADSVTVQLTINGGTQSLTITNPDEDSQRMIRAFTLPSLAAGIHPYRLEITSGAASGVGDLVFGFVVVAKSSAARIVATSCFQSGTPAALLDEDIAAGWFTGDAHDNAITSEVAPVNGSAAPLLRKMLAEQPTHWFHVDDAVYVGLTQPPTKDESPPLTLTDTSDDAPVDLYPMHQSNAGYTDSVVGASKSRNATAAQQMIYLWYEYSLRRRDVFNANLQGAEYYRVIGDNDVYNDFDMSWWSLAFNPASGGQRFDGMTTAAGDPYLTATFNPADFTNATNRANQIEANTYWRLLRSVWELYANQFAPPALTTTSQPPWIVDQLQASAGADPDYEASDYIPFNWKYDLGHTSVIAWDFFTSQDLNEITTDSSLNPVTNNYIQLNAANTHYLDGSGGNLRAIESPLGDANDSALLGQLATEQAAGNNVILLLPKEMGSLGRGNRDGLWRRNPEWIKSFYNSTIAGLSRPVLGIAGDWHIPSGIKNSKFLQLGVSPSSPITLSTTPAAGDDWDSLSFNISGVTDTISNITLNPSWTLDADTTGNDLYRFSYVGAVCESGSISAYQVDQRGSEVVTLHKLTSSITATGGSLPLSGVFNMAKDTIRSVLGEQGTFDGVGILCSGSGQQLAGGSVYHPLQRSNGTIACIIVGAANRSTGPSGNRGPVFSVLVGSGDITSAATTLVDKVAQLPDDFTISNGGYTLSKSDLTHAEDVTIYGVTVRTYRYSGGSASEYFGGSSTALVPTVARWTASEAGISVGDQRRSIDADIELYAESAGSAGTTEPPITGTYGNVVTISDGSLNWGQAISSEQVEFEVNWTDSSAGSGGSADVDHYLNGLPRSADGAIVTVTGS